MSPMSAWVEFVYNKVWLPLDNLDVYIEPCYILKEEQRTAIKAIGKMFFGIPVLPMGFSLSN